MSAIEKIADVVRHASARDLALSDFLELEADAFDACSLESLDRGDVELAEAEHLAAAAARLAAENVRVRS